jgi:hypothetical protein
MLCHRIKKHEMGVTCCTRGEMTDAYRVSVANVKGRIPLGIHTRRQEDIIKMGCRRFGYGGVYWIHLLSSCFMRTGRRTDQANQMGSPQGCGKTFELKGRGANTIAKNRADEIMSYVTLTQAVTTILRRINPLKTEFLLTNI